MSPPLHQRVLATLLRRYPFHRMRGTILKLVHERLAANGAKVWCKSPGGYVLADLSDLMGQAAYYFGDQDPGLTWICRQLVNEGDTVVDIGANIGVMTLLLSRIVGNTGVVYSFEPNPPIYAALAAALERNKVSNTQLQSNALGREPGTLELLVPNDNAGAGSLIRNSSAADCHRVTVRLETFDHFVSEHGLSKIHLIKMDVEGFEEQVLQGARRTFETIRPEAVLFEMNDYCPRPLFQHPVFRILLDFDYDIFGIQKKMCRVAVVRLDSTSTAAGRATDFIAVPRGERSQTAAARLGLRR